MEVEVKYVAYTCPAQPVRIEADRVERLSDGSVTYYLPCGSVKITRSSITLRGCKPEDLGLTGCRLMQRLVVIRGVTATPHCVTDVDGELYLKLNCDGRAIEARYYPSRATVVLFAGAAPLEECLEQIRNCVATF